jgi:hypothetical protein
MPSLRPSWQIWKGLYAVLLDKEEPIALCSDIGPMLLPRPGGGMSGVPKLTALCIKADIGGVLQFH